MTLTLQILETTKPYWIFETKQSLYHHALSLVISQRVKFSVGKNIRQRIFDIIPECKEYTPEAISKITDQQLQHIGLSTSKIACIRDITSVDKLCIESLSNIKGIGPWTIKALQIILMTNTRVSLVEDYWIRQRLSELKNLNCICTPKQGKLLFEEWKGYETMVSNFLWRIKPEGIINLKLGKELTRNDFL